MKRTITLLLIFVLLLSMLTSCELMVPDLTERPSIGLPAGKDAPDVSGVLEPAESAGLEEENYGFTVFPSGNYLVDPKFDTDGYLPDYDADLSFVQFLSTSGYNALCQTDTTVYSYNGRTEGPHFITYMDKATGISSPLCGKPECLHNDSGCNAYVPSYADGLCVYEGKLYWVSSSGVTRMNL